MGKTYHFLQLSSLEKVFVDDDISRMKEIDGAYALKGERISWQILYTADVTDSVFNSKTQVKVTADDRLHVLLRQVENVPVTMPTYPNQSDEYYLRKTPGVYPDLLAPLEVMLVREGRLHSLFVTCEVPSDMKAGEYPITLTFTMDDAEVKKTFTLRVLNASLPPQKLTYTQWFHADCLASHYNVEIFSEEHWERIDQFLAGAARIGINMILTPVFTLALDTEVGKERPTLQLVDVYRKNGTYSFGFTRLKRWIDLCKKNGIERFEISHLFAQWGTGFTPKIEAETENGVEKIFGWHTPAADSGYREFLQAFLPELIGFLKDEGVYENCVFHIFDEPNFEDEKHVKHYKEGFDMIKDLIPLEKVMDAVSHYELCEMGLVKNAVSIISSVDQFMEHGYTDIWAYTCCFPCDKGYSNRFIAMPSYRNRILGFQLYTYGINGFLNWGYNFYYSQLMRRKINPFIELSGDEGWPAGDTFSVYPGEQGPIESLRSEVFFEALQDIRACQLLETYIGRDEVKDIIGKITFNKYPRSNEEVLAIRTRINEKLAELI